MRSLKRFGKLACCALLVGTLAVTLIGCKSHDGHHNGSEHPGSSEHMEESEHPGASEHMDESEHPHESEHPE